MGIEFRRTFLLFTLLVQTMLLIGALLVGSLIAVSGNDAMAEAEKCNKELYANLGDISACSDITADDLPSCMAPSTAAAEAAVAGLVQGCEAVGVDQYKKAAGIIEDASDKDDSDTDKSGSAYLNVGVALLGSTALALIL